MVRDDFWLAATRFMDELEIELLKGQNTLARRSLRPSSCTQSADSVRNRLRKFARARRVTSPGTSTPFWIKRSPSLPRTARSSRCGSPCLPRWSRASPGPRPRSGGRRHRGRRCHIPGRDLQFASSQSQASPPPESRPGRSEEPCCPRRGTDIKGQMRSRQELAGGIRLCRPAQGLRRPDPHPRQRASPDHAHRPGGSGDDQSTVSPGGRYYQLTHDYLVHSLRDWLTRKQRETRRGRAELRLAERRRSWNAKPENRHLPSALEWANIRLLTKRRDWTEPQRRMMKRAGRVHGLRALGLVTLVSLITWGGDRGLWHTTGLGSGGVASESGHTRGSCHRRATLGLPPLG